MITLEQPIEVMKIFDNKGETVDLYSIHILYESGESYLICTSNNPTHPLGVFSRAEGHQFDIGEHLGEEIDWCELPESVQKVVISDIQH